MTFNWRNPYQIMREIENGDLTDIEAITKYNSKSREILEKNTSQSQIYRNFKETYDLFCDLLKSRGELKFEK